MLHNCSKAQDMQVKLYESYRHLLEQESFDPDLAAVRLLGQEISQIGSMETRHAVQDILAKESDENGTLRLITDMTRGVSLQNRQFEHALQLLKKLLQGMQDQDAE
jgi:predicted nucleotidyltransferase